MFKIDTTFKNANISRTIRFTEPLFTQLSEVAKRHEVSFNSLVLQCCQYALEQIEPEDPDSSN